IKAEPLGISNKSSWWYVVARHVPTNLQGPPSDYAEYVGVNDSRPYLLRSENRDNSTVVEFRSHALPKLEDGGYLQFVLYTAPSGNGPWNKQSVMDVSKKEGALSGGQMGKVTGVDRAEVIDTDAATAQLRTPPFYKVVLVERQPDGKEKEIESQVLGPGSERYIIARVMEPAKSGRGPERVRLADNSDLEYEMPGDALASESREPTWPTLRMSMSMAMPDQAYMHPGTHFTVNWIGKTYHFWSGAAHTYDSSSYLGKTMEVELPMQLGSAAMQISAVADDKSTAMRTITIVCNSPAAAKRKEAAAKSVEDDPKVKDLAARAESAPRRIAMLETELAAEKNEARMRELQQEILRLEELLAELEHERVNASRKLAMQSAMACEWDRAVALYNQVVRQQPAADARYAKLNQKSSDLGLLYTSGSKEQIAQQDARYIKKFRDVALEQRMLDHSRLMELATRAGDFVTVRYCALTLMSEIPTIPKDFEGQRFEVEPIARKLADATAMLTGDQQVAASWLSRAGVTNDLPHWMPVTRAENFPLRSLADELQSAEKAWREQTETTPPASSP
ncbi:MAG: hypothetical protein JNK57_10945, partial [Planctomycetaceae bacterium]|nr:hypothetical protein [Planctomycetaceae bacterium]